MHKTERQGPPPCPFREIRSTRSHDSRVGITPLRRLYDLRHTFATFALRAGIPTFDLSRFMAPASDHDRPPLQTEERVAALAAGASSNKEIATELFVSVHTVEAHLTRVYRKLGIRSRAQLAARLAGLTSAKV